MNLLALLADASDDINRWLEENPLVLGLIFILIGLAVGGWGIYELRKGVSYDKRGREVSGGMGKTLAIIRLVVGGGCIVFGLFRMLAG